MKVYIYKPKNQEFTSDDTFNAYLGFSRLGASIEFFDDFSNPIPYEPDTVVVGYVEDITKHLNENNISYPKPLNIPEELKSFRYRLGKNVPFSIAKGFTTKIFIKPVNVVKQFSSGIVTNGQVLSQLVDLPDDEIVYVGLPVEMLSEYRCFVYEGKLVGIKHYQGDFTLFPNIVEVNKMIEAYKSAPIAYTLDVAIQKHSGKIGGIVTSIVECNDMWAVGSYGLDPIIYAKMLRDRWFQLTGYRKW